MKLVKAKLKQNFEGALRATSCCSEYLEKIKADPSYKNEVILDIDDLIKEEIWCAYCRKSFGEVVGVFDITNKWYHPLDLFDLDEGEFNATRYLHRRQLPR